MAFKSMEIRKMILAIFMIIMFSMSSISVQSQGNDTLDDIQADIDKEELPLVKFRDISNSSGLGINIENWEQDSTGVESFTPGVSWGDYDNDGWIDIFITPNYDPSDLNSSAKPHLMHNNGDGTFSDVTVESGLSFESQSLSGIWGDYDNDGDLDIYISEFGTGFAAHGISIAQEYIDRIEENENATDGERWDVGKANKLFQNNGDGTFSDVTEFANVGNTGHSTESQWVDYDLDGDLDLYSLNWGIYIDELNTAYTESNVLYRNNGDGTFSDVTSVAELFGGLVDGPDPEPGTFHRSELGRADIGAGLSSSAQILHDSPLGTGMSWAALWFDHNGDNYPDVFIASDFGISPLYINEGDGTFKMYTEEAGMYIPGTGMGVDAGDYDGDGDLDLCQSNFGPEFIWNRNGDSYQQVVNTGKTGPGFFAAGSIQTTWVCEWFDYDNDADVDLFLSSGAISAYVPKRENIMYLNVGDWSDDEGDLIDVFQDIGLYTNAEEKTQGASVADFDNDGDLDLLLGNSNQPIRLFENLANEYEDRNWITFDLVGTQSNKQAIGANMTLWVDQNKFQVQQKFACSGSFGCSDQRMHFGLGDATKIHSVVVKWPSGETQEWFDLDINQIVILHEKQESKTHGGIIFMVGIVLFLGYILHRKG
ncbi:MAG: Uncharacterised protein [Methanobacteriota archaeon]|nr:MAG: Uncharacterised protein [Euryarchaeota archaeon]